MRGSRGAERVRSNRSASDIDPAGAVGIASIGGSAEAERDPATRDYTPACAAGLDVGKSAPHFIDPLSPGPALVSAFDPLQTLALPFFQPVCNLIALRLGGRGFGPRRALNADTVNSRNAQHERHFVDWRSKWRRSGPPF
jgi:hypothetical protein